jgi:hypothetical protein
MGELELLRRANVVTSIFICLRQLFLALLTQCKSTLHETQSFLMNNAVKLELVSSMADPFMYINGQVVIGKGVGVHVY